MRYLRLIGCMARAAVQEELAYRSNFLIGLLHSLLNFGTGVLGLVILFGQVEQIRGWTFAGTLALLGVYLSIGALRGLVIGPSLNGLAGLGGDIWTGKFDWTLLRPVDTQFLASWSRWRIWSVIDLLLGLGVLAVAVAQLGTALGGMQLLAFLMSLAGSLLALYGVLLLMASLVFWSPGFLFTWVFDGLFQMARYPVGLYPGWLRLLLTWVVPVAVITTLPAQALTGELPWHSLATGLLGSAALVAVASLTFRAGLRRYASASS